jgi:hypothetical protein
MSYGKNFKVYCLNRKVGMARIIDYFLRRFAGYYELGGLGETSLANMDPEKPPPTDTIISLKKAIFRRFMMLLKR